MEMDESVRFSAKWIAIIMGCVTIGLLCVIKFTTYTVELLFAITLVAWLVLTIYMYFRDDITDLMDWMWGDRDESHD